MNSCFKVLDALSLEDILHSHLVLTISNLGLSLSLSLVSSYGGKLLVQVAHSVAKLLGADVGRGVTFALLNRWCRRNSYYRRFSRPLVDILEVRCV